MLALARNLYRRAHGLMADQVVLVYHRLQTSLEESLLRWKIHLSDLLGQEGELLVSALDGVFRSRKCLGLSTESRARKGVFGLALASCCVARVS